MTHEYRLVVGATVLPGEGRPVCAALAWAADTILLVGTEDEIRALSRGDSLVLRADGCFITPADSFLESGGPADLNFYGRDPRLGDPGRLRAVVRAGRFAAGRLRREPAQAGGGEPA